MVTGGAEMMLGAIGGRFGHVIVCGAAALIVCSPTRSAGCIRSPAGRKQMVASLKACTTRGYAAAQSPTLGRSRIDPAHLGADRHLSGNPELDVNPLAVLPGGVSALDVRVRVSADHT
jgi:hypothetical protein